MGKFTERVQSGDIPGPLRRKFTPDRWKIAYSSIVDRDDRDRNIYEVALLIHEKLESIRDRVNHSSTVSLSATTKLRSLVAVANHNFLNIRTKTREALQAASDLNQVSGEKKVSIDQLMAQIKLPLAAGAEWSPDEIVASLVDGLAMPVHFALQEGVSLAGNPKLHEVVWDDILLEINLGVMYLVAEDAWNQCLWNDYALFQDEGLKVFKALDPEIMLGYVVGNMRRTALASNYLILGAKRQREIMAMGFRPRLREVIAIEQVGGQQVIKFSKLGKETQAHEEVGVLRGLANEPYYAELLDEAQPHAGGLTLSSVLDAWVILSNISHILIDKISEKEEGFASSNSDITWLQQCTPILRVDTIVKAFSSAANISIAESKRLVEFFTFQGRANQEIWASPLIPVGVGTVSPVFAAVAFPNLRRLVDVWMRQLQIDLGRRGPAFESHLRTCVADGIKASAILKSESYCVEASYTFKPSAGREEEIDLLFVIGNSVFLGEAKCIVEPTEANGIANHRRTVEGAARQIFRKAAALTDCRAEFIRDVERFGIRLTHEFSVIPFVIISGATHVGVAVDGIPVIDEYILQLYLEGSIETLALSGGNYDVLDRFVKYFYTNLDEAQANALQYLLHPPQMQKYFQGIKMRKMPIVAIRDGDWAGELVTLECEPIDDIEVFTQAGCFMS